MMVGNDIIDIELAKNQSNWKRKGWLNKVFVKSEQELVYNSSNPTKMVWKLWSMKEAAYKAHQRRFSFPPIYNPKSFVCTNDLVKIDSHTYITKSTCDDSYIYTLAHLSTPNYKTATYFKDTVSIKKRLQEYIALKYSIAPKDIVVTKNKNNTPNLMIHNEHANIQFSLTTHGDYSAFILGL